MNAYEFEFDVIRRAKSVIERFDTDGFEDEITGYIWHVEQLERSYETGFRYTKLKLTAHHILACIHIHEFDLAEKALPMLVDVAIKEQKRFRQHWKQEQEDAAHEIYDDSQNQY
jgi:hypothetical protein